MGGNAVTPLCRLVRTTFTACDGVELLHLTSCRQPIALWIPQAIYVQPTLTFTHKWTNLGLRIKKQL